VTIAKAINQQQGVFNMRMMIGRFAFAAAVIFSTAGPAWAGAFPPGVPAPVIGLGLPALIGMGMLYRRLRSRDDNHG
jgi:hypothetical protein